MNRQFYINQAKVLAGGGGFTDDPTNYANLYTWWKADSLSLSDNDPVGSWTDSSGTGNTATQSDSSKKPIFKTSLYNGFPAVRFDGSNDVLQTTVDVKAANQSAPWTLVTIAKAAVTNNTLSMMEGTNGDYWNRQTYAPGVGNRFGMRLIDLGFTNYLSNQLTQYGSLDLTMMVAFPNYAANQNIWYEGKTLLNAQGGLGWPAVLNRIGGPAQPWNGDICEICFWRKTFTPTELATIYDGYFKPKWNLP